MPSQINAPTATKQAGAAKQSNDGMSAINFNTQDNLLSHYRDVLDTKDVAEILGLKVATVRQMFREEQLPYFRVNKQYRIPKVRLIQHINEQTGGNNHE
ncbi:MAG: helix-turn-helix domain-containing protein [Coriobacteriia bacterium]|nr:helix-turn-helix domain-containing protein [Coriobacteriia bacterium]